MSNMKTVQYTDTDDSLPSFRYDECYDMTGHTTRHHPRHPTRARGLSSTHTSIQVCRDDRKGLDSMTGWGCGDCLECTCTSMQK